MLLSPLLKHKSLTALTLVAFVLASMPLSLLAQSGEKPGLAIMPLGRRGSVGNLAARRVEEYLRAMVEAGNVVRLIPSSTVDAGKASGRSKRKLTKAESRAVRQMEKADQAAITGREMLSSGKNLGTALKLLTAAIRTYEKYFVELADFTKLVDAYNRAAQAALAMNKKKRATLYLLRALTLQPSFVVDARRTNKDLQTILTKVRARLAKRSYGKLEIEATQPDCDVFVDGVKLGKAPLEAKDLPVGMHFVQVKKEGAKPWGQAVDVKGRKAIKVHAGVVMEHDPAHDIELMVKPGDVKPFAGSGLFHKRIFKNYGFMFARQIRARYLLYGVVAQSTRGVELHMFLYKADIKRTAALKTVYFARNLSNMQMKILEAEGHIRAAVRSFPTDQEVTALPDVYNRKASAPTVVAPPPVTTTPPPTTSPGATPAPTPMPKPTPTVVLKPLPKPKRKPVDPYANVLKPEPDDPEPSSGGVASRWWFWTGIGALVVGGGVAAYLLTQQEPAPAANFKVTATLPTN